MDYFSLALRGFSAKSSIRLRHPSLEVFARESSCRLANFSMKCDESVENTIKMEPNIMQSPKVERLNKLCSRTKLLQLVGYKEIVKILKFTS